MSKKKGLTVGELIKQLQNFDPDLPVLSDTGDDMWSELHTDVGIVCEVIRDKEHYYALHPDWSYDIAGYEAPEDWEKAKNENDRAVMLFHAGAKLVW